MFNVFSNTTFKIISAKTGNDLNDFAADDTVDHFSMDTKATYDQILPHKATFHYNVDYYHTHRAFTLKLDENSDKVQIINIHNGMKLAESKEFHQTNFNFFPAGFSKADDNTFFTIKYTCSGNIRILNENTGNYLVEVLSDEYQHFHFNNAIFLKGSTATIPNPLFNSEFTLVCLSGCEESTESEF